ncbi:MAG: hypothetical protein JNM65_13940 [Verrucomicrobiaceae bacterium]|nr:hypothetical protein [Verrucomicrobiaceae bacterium]
MSDPGDDGCELDEEVEVAGAGAGAGAAFEPAEEVLHPVELPVEPLVEFTPLFAVGFARETVRGTRLLELPSQLVGRRSLCHPPPSARADHQQLDDMASCISQACDQ